MILESKESIPGLCLDTYVSNKTKYVIFRPCGERPIDKIFMPGIKIENEEGVEKSLDKILNKKE